MHVRLASDPKVTNNLKPNLTFSAVYASITCGLNTVIGLFFFVGYKFSWIP